MRRTPGIHYSYIIRTSSETYYTLPSPNLPVVLDRIESKLVQLASQGHLTLEDVGTRIDDSRAFIADLIERNEDIKQAKISKKLANVDRQKMSDEERNEKRRLRGIAYRERKRREAECKDQTTQ